LGVARERVKAPDIPELLSIFFILALSQIECQSRSSMPPIA
jgi:hypothetical protein